VVVIIRGGGAQAELNCFNSHWLASHICQFPLPVLTGIGHEQDETITDLVAHTRLKTPTAVAEFLVDQYRQADEKINELSLAFYDIVSVKVREEKEQLNRFRMLLKPAVREQLTSCSGNLKYLTINVASTAKQLVFRESEDISKRAVRIKNGIKGIIIHGRHAVDILERKNSYLDPFLILKRGYSITYFRNKALRNPAQVSQDEVIETRLAGGTIKSKTI